ncbi:hypothetical protein ACJJI3_01170 [Microbulbifer sp. ZKSA004]|uniref:hypothetical protein n=1 Tax=unclassified Microbulbifer TaxID=2619833 RepID=UPI00403A6413
MKTALIFSMLVLISPSIFAQSVASQIKSCSETKPQDKRLSCYDQIAASLEQHAVRDFGREQKLASEEAPEKIDAKITAIQMGAYNKRFITLDNGQVWKQNDSSRVFWNVGDSVIVERALLGSFFMKPADGSRKLRVKRIK